MEIHKKYYMFLIYIHLSQIKTEDFIEQIIMHTCQSLKKKNIGRQKSA